MRATRIHVSSTLILLLLFLPGILVLTPANVYGKNNTTLVITLSGPTIAVGQSVTVSSTLSGATATAGGTVSYMLYSNPTCTPAASKTNTATVLNHVPGQTTFSPSVGGTFSINAVYSGDGANNPSPTSLCKQLIVSKTVTTTTTTITSSLSFPVGGAVTDTSSLSGANHATATGTVTYSIYQGSVCTGPVFLSSGALTITIPGTLPASGPLTINAAGTYSIRAAYSGDSQNQGSASACEPLPPSLLTVTKLTTSAITTTPSATNVVQGASVYDTAALSGVTANAGGTVTYTLYFSTACTGTTVGSSAVTVTNTLVPNSKSFVLSNLGFYYFKAVYSGDSNNVGATASCEQVTVWAAIPNIVTAFVGSSTISAGQSVTDSATLSGATATASGTVTYQLFTGGACGVSPIQTSTKAVSLAIVPNSNPFFINVVGTYSMNAVYSGDSNNKGGTSICEGPITVSIASPTLATLPSASSIPASGSVSDTATLTGSSGTNAGGTITLRMYTGAGCGNPSGSVVKGPVTASVSNNMATFGPFTIPGQSVGSYSFYVTYSGDANNNPATAPCEPFTVTPATVSLTTLITPLTPPPITTGQPITDTATLTGATSSAGGQITFSLYQGSTCSGTLLDTSTKTVTGGIAAPYTTTFSVGGSYSILAQYSGDSNNSGATAACETITINSVSTITTTLLNNPINAGQTAMDSATLSGVTSNAGGTVTYEVFPNGQGCPPHGAIDTDQVTVSGGLVPNSKAFNDFPTVGTYSFQAVYSGDAFNGPMTSNCEPLTVNKASVTISTQLPATQIFSDGTITDSATLASETSSAGGTVTYNLYPNGVCTGPIVPGQTDTETVINGVVPSTSTPLTPNGLGTFGIKATYSGDTNNQGASSSCEVFTVVKHSPSLTTLLGAQSIFLGGTITDSSTLANAGPTAGGTVTYNLYPNGACTGPIVPGQTDTETVTNGIVPSTSTPLTPNAAGTFGISAVYSGDANNNGFTSTCEPLTVRPVVVSISTGLNTPVNVGQTVTDVATLTGATGNAGGSITFTLYSGTLCSGPSLNSFTTPVTNGVENGAYITPTFNTGGPYSIQAVYSGDSNNAGATSACEQIAVVATPITLTTALSQTTITDVQSVYDTSSLSNAYSGAGGTVTYNLFPTSAAGCVGVPSDTSQVTVTGAIVPNSKSFSGLEFTPPGTYYFNAVYSGDAYDAAATSGCELLTVNAATPTISIPYPSGYSAISISAGGQVTVTAILTGATSNAGGTVTYTLESGVCGGLSAGTQTVTVSNGVVPSATFTIANAGTYVVSVSYSGDTNNNAAGPSCTNGNTITVT